MKNIRLLPLVLLLACVSCSGNTSEVSSDKTDKKSDDISMSSRTEEGDTKQSQSSQKKDEEPVLGLQVTFDLNFEGSTSSKVAIQKGSYVNPIATPKREGYLFNSWTLDKEGKEAYDWSKVLSDTTLYAQWILDDAKAITVTYHWNYEGVKDEVFYQTSVSASIEGGSARVKAITPHRDNYYFKAWYIDKEYSDVYTTMSKYEDGQDFYARWFDMYTFEAEHTQLTDLPEDDLIANDLGEKIGHGYSSDVSGLGLIQTDGTMSTSCSNGKYITDLYYNGVYIQFEITASEDINDAIFIATLSAEYFDMTFSTVGKSDGSVDSYLFEVNGVNFDYGTIELKNVITDRSNPDKRPFSDFTLSTSFHLNKGKNIIKLITNNNHRHDSTGTMASMAPMVDCLKFYTDTKLTFREFNI